MSQTPMVLPRTHLGSSQNSKSEAICPGLEIQTKSILCTLAFQPNPIGSSQNSSWVIPDLNVWGNLSWTRNTNKVNTLHTCLWAKPLWFLPELTLVHPRSQCLRKSVQDWLMSQTPMVLPRTHLGSSQISMSEEISPRLKCKQSKNFAHCPMSQALWFFQKLIQLFQEAIVSENLP